MTVSFNSPLTSSNVNNSFMSKNSDTGTTGKINQTNITNATNSTDGAFHTDGGASIAKDLFVGQVLNATIFKNIFKTFAVEDISGGGSISKDDSQAFQMRRIQGQGGPATASTTPFGSLSAMQDGTVILLFGQSDTNTIKITYNDIQYGAFINGDAELKKGYCLALMYDSINERLFEICRNF